MYWLAQKIKVAKPIQKANFSDVFNSVFDAKVCQTSINEKRESPK